MKHHIRCTLFAAALVLGAGVPTVFAQGTGLPFNSTFEVGDFSEWQGFRNTTGAVIMSTRLPVGSVRTNAPCRRHDQ